METPGGSDRQAGAVVQVLCSARPLAEASGTEVCKLGLPRGTGSSGESLPLVPLSHASCSGVQALLLGFPWSSAEPKPSSLWEPLWGVRVTPAPLWWVRSWRCRCLEHPSPQTVP